MRAGSQTSSKSYFPHSVLATVWVTTAPLLAVRGLESAGWVAPGPPSLLVGVALCWVAAALGSALWMRCPGSRDLVFADLMLWGFVRRARMERFLGDIRNVVGRSTSVGLGSHVDPKHQVEILHRLTTALESVDPYAHGHSARVARHAEMIARAMKLPRDEIELIRTAAAVHDVGKVYVPHEVLVKPGRLTHDEYVAMKEHARKGGELVAEIGNPRLAAIVRHHHERLDGGGYPDGLVGGAIPLGARIVAVADTFDAITSTRAYRPAARHRKAVETLRSEAGSQLDAEAVAAFLAYYSGRSSIVWWANLTTAPQRLMSQALQLLREAGASGIAATALTAGAAVLVSGPVTGRAPLAHAREEIARAVTAGGSSSVRAAFSRPISRRSLGGNSNGTRTRDDRRPTPSGRGMEARGSKRNPEHFSSDGEGSATPEGSGTSPGDESDSSPPGASLLNDVDKTAGGTADAAADSVEESLETVDEVVGGIAGAVDETDWPVNGTLQSLTSLP